MPTYEYRCKCGRVIEAVRRISQCSEPIECPCGEMAERILSLTSFQLKGDGWYRDLYSSKKPADKKTIEKQAIETAT